MHKFSAILIATCLAIIPSVITSQDVDITPTVEPISTVVVDVPSTTVDSSDTNVIDNAQTNPGENPWVSMVWSVVALLIGTLVGAITILSKFGLKKLEEKLGMDVPKAVEDIAEGYLVKGINWTENWAKEKSEKPTSENKLAETIRFALDKAGENPVIRKRIEDKGKEIIERLLKSKTTPDEATPK